MEDDEDMPPFWLQSTSRRSRQVSSFFLSSGVFIVLLVIIAFFLVFVIVPSLLSITSQIFRPHLVKKSWDSLNLVLVIFAIVCGFLNINKTNNNETPRQSYYREQNLSNNVKQDQTPRSCPETPPRWYHQFQQDPIPRLSRLRSFSSYPDLRQESSWISNDQRWRFYDDTRIDSYRLSSSDQLNPEAPLHQETKKPQVVEQVLESAETKDVSVDSVVLGQDKEVIELPPSPPPAPSPPPPLPQSPPHNSQQHSKAVKRKVKRSFQDVEKKYPVIEESKLEEVNNFYKPPSPPPLPVHGKNDKRRGKDFLISLRRRKKKQKQKSVENLESFFNLETSLPSLVPPPSPPPPPPPP